jgi:hypothetical protein
MDTLANKNSNFDVLQKFFLISLKISLNLTNIMKTKINVLWLS